MVKAPRAVVRSEGVAPVPAGDVGDVGVVVLQRAEARLVRVRVRVRSRSAPG